MTARVRVEMSGVTKRYPRVVANRDASFSALAGEVHALVGENGAGKSTLMKILYGQVEPDAGRIVVDGRLLQRHTPKEAIQAGVGMVFQHFMLADALTIAESVLLGREPRRGPFLDRRAMREAVALAGERFGLPVDPERPIAECSVGLQQRVEILKVLIRGAEIIILDEPTAVLTPAESDELLATLRALSRDGRTIVLITHKLREVMAAADRVTIMRAGQTLETLETQATTPAAIAERMVGHPVSLPTKVSRTFGPPVLALESVEAASDRGVPALSGVSFEVRAGEVVGIAGIEGNGQSELIECIAGLRKTTRGRIRLGEHDATHEPPEARLRAGLAHVPEDRHARGVVLELSVAENAILGGQRAFSRPLGLDAQAVRAHAEAIIQARDVRPPDARVPVSALSGGNQQKLVLGRELARRPRLLLAAHPTRGLDLRAMEAVHHALLEAALSGTGILLLSADLTELLALSDRVVVLFEGRISGVVDPREVDERRLGLLMASRAGEEARS